MDVFIKVGNAQINRKLAEGKTRDELGKQFSKIRPEILDEVFKQLNKKAPAESVERPEKESKKEGKK